MQRSGILLFTACIPLVLAACSAESPGSGEAQEAAANPARQQLEPGIEYEVLQPADPGSEPVSAPFIRFEAEMNAGGETLFSSAADGVFTFPMATLEAMVPGLARALAASPAGEKRRWWIAPEHMQPGGFREPVTDTVTAELVVLGGREPLPAPDDVAGPPADAQVTDSGLAYKRLTAGAADGPHPDVEDTVVVHYTGWRAETGDMFDSSVIRDQPAEFPLSGVIPGWTEAVQLMRPGDAFRVWIPGALAYDDSSRPGAPKGMLVFDIELLEIRPQS